MAVQLLLSAIQSKVAKVEGQEEALAVPVLVPRVTCKAWENKQSLAAPVVLTVRTVVRDFLQAAPDKERLHGSSAKLPGNCMRAAAGEVPVGNYPIILQLELVVKAVAVLAAEVLLELLALKIPEVVAVEVPQAGKHIHVVCPVPVALA